MSYSTDLTDEEWSELEPILLSINKTNGGAPRKWCLRQIVDAIFYICKNGCTWRNLPNDFPPYYCVYAYKRKLCKLGVFEKIHNFFLTRSDSKRIEKSHHPLV